MYIRMTRKDRVINKWTNHPEETNLFLRIKQVCPGSTDKLKKKQHMSPVHIEESWEMI